MRFMIIRRADKLTESGTLPSEELLAAMGQYMEEMHRAGILLGGEGLHPSSKGKRVNFKGGRPMVVDGPFTETKELIAGYSMIDVPSMKEAVEWVKKWPKLDVDVSLEIRPLFEADDFGDEFTPELRAREEKMRQQVAAKASKQK